MNTLQILIVDDDVPLLQALSAALRQGMPELNVATCECPVTALERIAFTDYDAVVCDIKMPALDGLTLLARIREIRPDVPVLLITGLGDYDVVVQALRGGAYDFLPKPIDSDYLQASLKRAIGMRRLGRQVEEQQRALERHAGELEKTVAERTRELREANRAKDDFLALLAHELRNPLAPMLNAVHVLRLQGSADPYVQQARGVLERQVQHMARLLDDLLDVSRISRNRIELRKQALDLAAVIAEAVETSRPIIDAQRHEIAVNLPAEPLPVEADPTRLEQVLANLLNNAAKYTEPGGQIRLTAAREGDEAVVRVRDTGLGISTDMLPRIFDPFTQADRSLARSQGGLGIGLTLVRSLVELHGGKVAVASDGPGMGSEFTVRLPLLAVPRPPVDDAERRPDVPAPRQVLIIEDNADGRDTLRLLLELWGHQVDVAEDGLQGVRKALGDPPEVALVDIGLPGLDGYGVARQLRASPRGGDVFLIALTGYGQPEDRRRALEAGFDAHLIKPVNPNELSDLLAGLATRNAG